MKRANFYGTLFFLTLIFAFYNFSPHRVEASSNLTGSLLNKVNDSVNTTLHSASGTVGKLVSSQGTEKTARASLSSKQISTQAPSNEAVSKEPVNKRSKVTQAATKLLKSTKQNVTKTLKVATSRIKKSQQASKSNNTVSNEDTKKAAKISSQQQDPSQTVRNEIESAVKGSHLVKGTSHLLKSTKQKVTQTLKVATSSTGKPNSQSKSHKSVSSQDTVKATRANVPSSQQGSSEDSDSKEPPSGQTGFVKGATGLENTVNGVKKGLTTTSSVAKSQTNLTLESNKRESNQGTKKTAKAINSPSHITYKVTFNGGYPKRSVTKPTNLVGGTVELLTSTINKVTETLNVDTRQSLGNRTSSGYQNSQHKKFGSKQKSQSVNGYVNDGNSVTDTVSHVTGTLNQVLGTVAGETGISKKPNSINETLGYKKQQNQVGGSNELVKGTIGLLTNTVNNVPDILDRVTKNEIDSSLNQKNTRKLGTSNSGNLLTNTVDNVINTVTQTSSMALNTVSTTADDTVGVVNALTDGMIKAPMSNVGTVIDGTVSGSQDLINQIGKQINRNVGSVQLPTSGSNSNPTGNSGGTTTGPKSTSGSNADGAENVGTTSSIGSGQRIIGKLIRSLIHLPETQHIDQLNLSGLSGLDWENADETIQQSLLGATRANFLKFGQLQSDSAEVKTTTSKQVDNQRFRKMKTVFGTSSNSNKNHNDITVFVFQMPTGHSSSTSSSSSTSTSSGLSGYWINGIYENGIGFQKEVSNKVFEKNDHLRDQTINSPPGQPPRTPSSHL